MLRGANAVSMDGKGRLAIPKRYREELQSTCEGLLVCTIDHHFACLLLYPLDEWEKVESRLAKLSSLNPAERRLQRLLLGHAIECPLDSQGRILIPPTLRQYAELESRAMLVGQLNKFEIWQEARWQEQIEEDITLQTDLTASERLSDFSL
ncbi:division/cell wall cluster transcriptional repressor MraZ [Thaumasiovibrio subtropicus]|uniref:division/cell wall cluster transcriptional repressor MraZ n=1 Tax=Thaumasiovibrio subtropicus TaxID=1891207 RepID=UPI000B35A749|nr:division/cell wall cluster transcriptional repressor MraZ [Thaumasiovibrio subtropicus]